MEKYYELIFDDVMIRQLKKASKNQQIKAILSRMFNRLELVGHMAGKLLDSKLLKNSLEFFNSKNLPSIFSESVNTPSFMMELGRDFR